MSTKKAKRLESKKRKAVAFVSLVKNQHIIQAQGTSASAPMIEQHTPNMDLSIQSIDDQDLSENKTPNVADDEKEEDVFAEMKKIVRDRRKQTMTKPKVFLCLEDMVPYRVVDGPLQPDIIPPLYTMDVQHLLLYAAQGNLSSHKPRWCKLLRVGKVSSVVFIILDGIGYSDYMDNKDSFPYITDTFDCSAEVVCPLQYNRTAATELHNVPLSVSQLKKANVKVPASIKSCVAAKLLKPPNPPKETKETKDAEEKVDTDNTDEKGDKASPAQELSRRCLLLSTQQMMSEGYPLPITNHHGNFRGFVFSKRKYEKVTESSPLLALDCEMCLTTAQRNELTRVSIVTETGELIYDKLVKPHKKIINYLTRFSGITKELLEPVTTRIEDVQNEIRELLPADAILCGQSLNCDLMALKMFHPYVIDTSVIFNMSGVKGVKAGLRKLTGFFLNRVIQNRSDGHCSNEDALAALDLVKLKLSKGLEFGDATLSGIYFPDIRTYFQGEEQQGDGKKKTENIEAELPAMKNGGEETYRQPESQGSEYSRTSQCNPAVSDSEDSDDDEDKVKDKEVEGEPTSKKPKLSGSDDTVAIPNTTYQGVYKDYFSTIEFVMEQTKFLFSQDNSVHVDHSFFKLIFESGRPACMIDRELVTNEYLKDPIVKLVAPNDTIARKTAKKEIGSREFMWLRFGEMTDLGGKDFLKEDKWKRTMRKVDSRVKSVLKHAKPNCLAVVLMSGRRDGEGVQNMVVNVKTC